MNNRVRRLLQGLIVIFAITMMMSVPAAAASKKTVATIGKKSYTSLASAVKAVKNGQTIKLKKNTTIKSALNRNKKYTIDLNGYTLTGTYEYVNKYNAYEVRHAVRITKGKVTLKNGDVYSIFVGKGVTLTTSKVNVTYDFNIRKGATVKIKSGIPGKVKNYGTLTITKATFKNRNSEAQSLSNEASGKVTINGGTFKTTVTNLGTMSITGGTFSGGHGCCIQNYEKTANLTIKGGTFKDTEEPMVIQNYESGTLKITGGTFTSKGSYSSAESNAIFGAIYCASGAKAKITGGTISSKYCNGVYVANDAGSFSCSGAKITVSASGMKKISDNR